MAELLVDASGLADVLTEVSVLDVRWQLGRDDGHEQYLAGHVPGAAYVDLASDLAGPPGDGRGRHPLPEASRFEQAMRRCGVRGDRPVVVYDDWAGLAAARAWWLLRFHGHPDVRLLDGGWSAWQETGTDVESGAPAVVEGDFAATPGQLPVLVADAAGRLAREGVLLDARAPERFRGETEPVDPVAGHVPGAVNAPAADNVGGGRFLPRAELSAVYDAAGAVEGAHVGVYCGSGVTAAHDVFALALLGRPAALYPGSWSEWVSDPSRPVATGA